KETRRSCLEGIPRSLPALQRADLIQTKVSRVGFDWPDYSGAMDKVLEELGELKEVLQTQNKERITDELGDLLFATVNLARLLGVDAEEALRHTMEKFSRRFSYVEEKIATLDTIRGKVPLEEMDKWWEAAKNLEKR
ncbi:MAG: MazG nucleotide pyrophosphohydrolase domain-containing protein, partial [Bacillota bacterium]|nr:MazG nucleotide pyrophosphohydrolase domain-containing protein [Bacillota bacterium]